MIPWGTIESHPTLVVLVPFSWLLWQLYVPRLVDAVVQHEGDGHLYQTWWTKTRGKFLSQFDRVDERIDTIGDDVERIAETQEDLVNITVAQSHQMNGYDGDIDVDNVEETLLDDKEDGPRDFLRGGGRYTDDRSTDDSESDDVTEEP